MIKGRNKTLVGLGAVLFIGGVAVLLFGFLQFQKARESSDWPNVKGQVLSSDVETRRYSSIDNRSIPHYTYLPRVEYIYSVNGIEHRKFSIQLTALRGVDSEQPHVLVPRGSKGIPVDYPQHRDGWAIRATKGVTATAAGGAYTQDNCLGLHRGSPRCLDRRAGDQQQRTQERE